MLTNSPFFSLTEIWRFAIIETKIALNQLAERPGNTESIRQRRWLRFAAPKANVCSHLVQLYPTNAIIHATARRFEFRLLRWLIVHIIVWSWITESSARQRDNASKQRRNSDACTSQWIQLQQHEHTRCHSTQSWIHRHDIGDELERVPLCKVQDGKEQQSTVVALTGELWWEEGNLDISKHRRWTVATRKLAAINYNLGSADDSLSNPSKVTSLHRTTIPDSCTQEQSKFDSSSGQRSDNIRFPSHTIDLSYNSSNSTHSHIITSINAHVLVTAEQVECARSSIVGQHCRTSTNLWMWLSKLWQELFQV